MSVLMTFARLIITFPSLMATFADWPSTVLTSLPSSLTTSAAMALPGMTWYLRIATSFSLFSGLSKLSSVPSGSLAQSFVGQQHGERTVSLQRLDEAGGLDGGDQRLEIVGAGRGVDDVFSFAGEHRHCECDERKKQWEICAYVYSLNEVSVRINIRSSEPSFT